MKLESFKINGFKSLLDVSINQLSDINMLYGYNNSGKSNILKFIELVFKRKVSENTNSSQGSPNFWEGNIENSSFFFNTSTDTGEIEFEFLFKIEKKEIESTIPEFYKELANIYFVGNNHPTVQFKIKGSIQKSSFYTSQIRLSTVKLNNKSFYESQELIGETYLGEITSEGDSELFENRFPVFQSVLGILNDSVLFLDNDRYFESEKNEQVNFENLSPKNFKKWLYSLYINPETYPVFTELIKFFSDFKVETAQNDDLKNCELNSPFKHNKISFSESQNGLMVMLESNGKRLPLSNFGTGIQQIFFLLAKIFASNAKIILVEEVELNLSPRYQGEFLK
ncbi:hypothetical protein EON78_00945, partial [bacterium]